MIFAVADAHCDYLYGAMQRGYDMYSPKPMQCLTKERLRAGGVALQCFAAWVDTGLRSTPSMQLVQMLDRYHSLLESDPDFVPFTQDYSPSSGKIACLLTIEGGEAIDGSLAALRNAYRLGVRAMTLTWNENNELADCRAFDDEFVPSFLNSGLGEGVFYCGYDTDNRYNDEVPVLFRSVYYI